VPFLKLTRDRRGFEHTYLLHADSLGERPRLLYWYRTAPEVAVGRPALDEVAIRQIEDQHPLIDFDWPAILAMRDAMHPEEDVVPQGREARRDRRSDRRDESRDRGRARGAARSGSGMPPGRGTPPQMTKAPDGALVISTPNTVAEDLSQVDEQAWTEPPDVEEVYEAAEGQDGPSLSADGLLEELVGRDIATRLRARHADLLTRIRELSCDDQVRADWLARADVLDPDTWVTPHDVLDGVQHADQRFDEFRRRLTGR
jgi:hypothetical protein